MTARASVVINDRAATPVAHTFSPDGDDKNGVHLFSEKTGVPVSNPKLTAYLKPNSGKLKPTLRLTIPVVQTQTINGISTPVVVRTAYVELAATFDAASTQQERKDAIGLMANAMAASQTMLNPFLVDGEDIW